MIFSTGAFHYDSIFYAALQECISYMTVQFSVVRLIVKSFKCADLCED